VRILFKKNFRIDRPPLSYGFRSAYSLGLETWQPFL